MQLSIYCFFYLVFTFFNTSISSAQKITAFKLFEEYDKNPSFSRPVYKVPASSHFQTERKELYLHTLKTNFDSSNWIEKIDYYLSLPANQKNFPIVLIITGSVLPHELANSWSIIDLHRHYIEEIESLNCALLTIERLGCNDTSYDQSLYKKHYSVAQRIFDHETVLNELKKNPPKGWNGKIILWGISEGVMVAQQLAKKNPNEISLFIVWAFFLQNKQCDYVNFFLEDINRIMKDHKDNYKKQSSLWSYLITYSSIYIEYIKEKFSNIFQNKLQKILNIWHNDSFALVSPIKKNDFFYFAQYLLKNNNENISGEAFGFPLAFWKSLFELKPLEKNELHIPIKILVGEEDRIVAKYAQKNSSTNPHISVTILPKTPHRIRKNSLSLETTLQEIKKVLNK
jgi:pimeloyl-ACP methyl ester carboxylesterase